MAVILAMESALADKAGLVTCRLEPLDEATHRGLEKLTSWRSELAEEVAGLIGATLGVDVEVDGDEVVLPAGHVKLALPAAG